MTEPRRPLHLAVALGVSAGVYAASLAGVTTLEAGQEAALAADRAPAADALATLRAHNDRLAAQVEAAAAAFDAAAGGYRRIASGLDRLDRHLAKLGATVARIEGAAVALPARAPLPSVSRASVSVAPAVHATTGASGR